MRLFWVIMTARLSAPLDDIALLQDDSVVFIKVAAISSLIFRLCNRVLGGQEHV
jgi:hypothetical protein